MPVGMVFYVLAKLPQRYSTKIISFVVNETEIAFVKICVFKLFIPSFTAWRTLAVLKYLVIVKGGLAVELDPGRFCNERITCCVFPLKIFSDGGKMRLRCIKRNDVSTFSIYCSHYCVRKNSIHKVKVYNFLRSRENALFV